MIAPTWKPHLFTHKKKTINKEKKPKNKRWKKSGKKKREFPEARPDTRPPHERETHPDRIQLPVPPSRGPHPAPHTDSGPGSPNPGPHVGETGTPSHSFASSPTSAVFCFFFFAPTRELAATAAAAAVANSGGRRRRRRAAAWRRRCGDPVE